MALDFTAFESFHKNLQTLQREFETWLTSFLLMQGNHFIRAVKPRTPVDTGQLRGAWELDGITRRGAELHVWFVNPTMYATFVEYGHAKPYKSGAGPGSADWVEGYFMMTVSLDEINRKMPARFEREAKILFSQLGVT